MELKKSIEFTPYLASAYAEGFCEGEDATMEEQILAWSYLIETKLAWSLQGWYGRQAHSLISEGIIDENGFIDWEKIHEL